MGEGGRGWGVGEGRGRAFSSFRRWSHTDFLELVLQVAVHLMTWVPRKHLTAEPSLQPQK